MVLGGVLATFGCAGAGKVAWRMPSTTRIWFVGSLRVSFELPRTAFGTQTPVVISTMVRVPFMASGSSKHDWKSPPQTPIRRAGCDQKGYQERIVGLNYDIGRRS